MAVRRKRIGVLVGNANAEHMRSILNGMYHAVKDFGIDLVIIAGPQIQYDFADGEEMDNDYEFLNFIHSRQLKDNEIDGVVICYGSHAIYMNELEKADLLDKYSDVPYILMEEFSDGENTGYIINDNYNGMRKVVEHLVSFHGYNKFLYLGGVEGIRDSIERQRAFEDVLSEHDIPFDNSMMTNGGFVEKCEDAVRELLDNNELPDAIVCASDFMAMAVYKVCKERGIRIGNPQNSENTVAVTGYDDVVRASSLDPPLTTILQDFYYAGYTAIERILGLIRDGIVDGCIVPTMLQKRSSCGCCFYRQHRFVPMTDNQRSNPEFYAIKVAEVMREEILISDVGEDIGDKVYDIVYDAIYRDIMIYNGLIKESLTSDMVIDQLRELLKGPYGQYISPFNLINAFSDYLSTLIHGSNDQRLMIIISDIMMEGMKYLQAYMFNKTNEKAVNYEEDAWQISLVARDMLLAKEAGQQEMFKKALEKIGYSDGSDLYIFLFENPVMYESWKNHGSAGRIKLVAKKNLEEGIVTYSDDDMPIVEVGETLMKYASECEDAKSNRYCLANIYHKDRMYGVLLSRMDHGDILRLSLAATQIGIALSNVK